MVSAEISLKTELGKENLLAQVRSWVEKSFPEDYPNREREIEYRRRAEFWVQEIEPTPSLTVRIAALTHDIECAFPRLKHEGEESNHSAEIVAEFLRGLGLPENLIIGTTHLIRGYETGGDFRSTLLRDAVSIAFLEVKARDGQEPKDRIDLMYNRIWIPRAKEKAEGFYNQAMTQVGKKRLEEKGREEERQQALKEYWRLVKEHSRKHSATDEQIEALHKARDRVLALFSR